jgi:hypothetical protein
MWLTPDEVSGGLALHTNGQNSDSTQHPKRGTDLMRFYQDKLRTHAETGALSLLLLSLSGKS